MTRRLRSSRATTIGAALAAVVAVLGGVAVAASSSEGSGGGANKGLVITAEAQRRTLTDSVTVKGTLGRVEQRQVGASSAGRVSAVQIEDGAEVQAGQSILSLDGRDSIAEAGDFPFFRSLDIGSHGEDVRQLETILDGSGFHPGKVDKVYTGQTRSALAQWQASHGYPGAAPEHPENVTVSLTPSGGYTVGKQSSAGVIIEPTGGVRASSASSARPAPDFHATSSANPSLSIHAVAAVTAEGAPAVFRIDADDTPATDLEIQLTASGGAGSDDVVEPVGTIAFPADTWSVTVSVPTRQDRLVEGDEELVLTLVDGADYEPGADASASTVIIDDDLPEMHLTGGDTVSEGEAAIISVVADQAPEHDTQVTLTLGGDAVGGKDYRSIDPIVLLPAGDTSVDVPITTLTDDLVESDERIVVGIAPNLSNYRVGPAGAAIVTIAQDSGDAALPTVTLRPTATSIREGQPFPLTVSLDRPLTDELVLDLRYAGTAREGDDFAPLGRVVVPAGQTTLSLQVPTVQDDQVEIDQLLSVAVVPTAHYRVGLPVGGATTIESDDVPELALLGGGGDLGAGARTAFTIVADQAPVVDISVSYSALGSATPGQDFNALTGTAILHAGETTLTVPLLTLADDVQFVPTDMVVGHWPIRVGQVLVKEGESVLAGAPLLSLTDSGLTVTLHASASDRTRLKTGQKVKVTLSGSSDEAEGVISKLDETAKVDEKTKEQYYEGTVDVGDLKAADGANVTIEVVLDQQDEALTVPIAAVKQNGAGKDVVRVLDLAKGGVVEEIPVTTGISEGSYIEIRTGLKGGEVVIVEVDDKG